MTQLKRVSIYRGGPQSWNPNHIQHHRIMNQSDVESNVVSMLDNLFEEYESDENLDLFIDQCWEPIHNDMLEDIKYFINGVKQSRPSWRIFLQLNTHSKHHKSYFEQLPLNGIVILDFFLYQVVRQTVITNSNPVSIRSYNKFIDPKFLFLTGRAHKPHRIRLLKRFADCGLLDNATWSFFYHDQSTFYNDLVRDQLPELSDQEFDDFVTKWTCNPDQILQSVGSYGTQYDGFPYGVEMYSNTDFSVISETNFDITSNPWITEKTWRPIINGHPFIVAGDSGTYKHLKGLGFETFEKLLAVPKFYEIADVEQRLDLIVKNVQHWADTLSTHADFVNASIIHNKKTLIHLYDVAYNQLSKFIQQHDLTSYSLDEVLPTLSGNLIGKKKTLDTFVAFYNNIKDPAWPECKSESDFYLLPQKIQDECIGFGYAPAK